MHEVTVGFDAEGNWMVGVAPRDEDTKMLAVTFDQQPRMDGEGFGYSARATVQGVNVVTYESGDESDA